ncbi:alpha/beta fold hydrolase [Leifsonia lichenia]
MSRRGVRVVAVVVAAVAVLTGCSPTQVTRVEEDLGARPYVGSFYRVPSPLPDGAPGSLIATEEAPGQPSGAAAWRIMFRSTDLDGKPVVNSGLLVVPDKPAPAGGRTIVSWGHPTTGSAEKCAPSRFFDPYVFVEGLTDLLSRGYAVVYTDYTGMGVPGPDSYLIGDTEGRNVLDAARAARDVLGAEASNRVVLWGHSQGGQAALFAAQLAASYAPDLDVRAAAVAAPATDLASLMRADIGDISGVSIASYAFAAFSSVYDVPAQSILTPAAVDALPTMNGFCLLTQNSALHAVAKPLVGSFLSADPETTEPWSGLLAANTPGASRIAVPLFVAQGLADKLVRPSATDAFVAREKGEGTAVTYDRIEGATHGTVANKAMPRVLEWLAANGGGASG